MPQQQLEQLQAELVHAMTSTQSLEAQVQQLKQQAAVASEQREAAVQQQAQQAQQGNVEAAGKVTAALEAAAVRHGQQTLALQERLIEAHQQLQAARSELSALQQEQQLHRQSMVERGAQTGSPAAVVPAASQTDAWVAPAEAALLPAQAHWQPPPSSAGMLKSPSRGSACVSPAYSCSRQSPAALPVAVTAMQLQLELARVKITPLKPLPGSSLRAGSRLQQAPSRLGSAYGEHAQYSDCVAQHQQLHQHHASSSFSVSGGGGGGTSLAVLAAMQRSAELEAGPGSSGRLGLEEDEEDAEDEACFATPLAQTPTAFSAAAAAEASPFSGAGLSPGLGDGATGWSAQQRQSQSLTACSHQQHQQGGPVPALDLHLVRPYSSLSCDSYGGPDSGRLPTGAGGAGGAAGGGGGMFRLHAEASTSVSSLSSLGPSASQVACWTPGVAAAGGGSPACSRAAAVRAGRGSIDSGYDVGLFGGGSIGGASWQPASLDASLARLAQLTTGLRR